MARGIRKTRVHKVKLLDRLKKSLADLAIDTPFEFKKFYSEHEELIKKYLLKDTKDLAVEDWAIDDVPSYMWYKNQEGLLKSFNSRSHNCPLQYSLLQKLEWIKCYLDVAYFAKKHVNIISLDEGVVKFDLYDYQEALLQLYDANRFCIIMQARQSGKTITTATYLCHTIIFKTAKTCAVLGDKAATAQEILERIQTTYELLPLFLQRGVRVYNKRSMKLSNNSRIFSSASGKNAIRGKSLDIVYLDETAFLPNSIQFYESTYPTISSGTKTKILMSSTPNGTRGMFYKIWQDSVTGKNTYVNFTVTWDMVPGRTEKWKRQTIANTSQSQFDQEYNCIFRGASHSLIPGEIIEKLFSIEPVEKIGDLKIFEHPTDGHVYFTTVDTSEGIGQDFHAITVVDISVNPFKVVATLKNNVLSPLVLDTLIHNVATKYNNSFVLIELASTGTLVADKLYNILEYENILMSHPEKDKQVLGPGATDTPRLGIKPTRQVKLIGCTVAKTLIESGKIQLNDYELIEEFGNFVPSGGSYAAISGAHDDQAMTIVTFAWATTQQYFLDLTDENVQQSYIDGLSQKQMDTIMPFGIIDNGVATYDGDTYKTRHREYDRYVINRT